MAPQPSSMGTSPRRVPPAQPGQRSRDPSLEWPAGKEGSWCHRGGWTPALGDGVSLVPLPWALPHKTRSRPFLPGAAEGRCSVCPQRSRPCCHLRGEQSPWAQVWLCRGGRGHFKKIKVISCCSCWQGPVRPEPGGLKQFHNPGDFLLIGIMKPITNIKSHSLKRQPERGRDTPGPLRPPGTAALAPPGKRCPPGTPVLRGGASGGGRMGCEESRVTLRV